MSTVRANCSHSWILIASQRAASGDHRGTLRALRTARLLTHTELIDPSPVHVEDSTRCAECVNCCG